jgi:3',5'-cyclic AMP phosphodiesterase CpdA
MTDIGTRDEYEIFYAFLKDAQYPVYVLPGNHDLTTTGRVMYRKIFGPENSSLDTSFGRLIFFNNNPLEVLPEKLNYDFLSSAISTANTSRPLFIFQHQNPANQESFSAADQSLYQGLVTGFGNDVFVFHGHLHSFNRTQIGGNTEVFQVARVEKKRWALVEVDNTEVRVFFCERRSCSKVFP